MSVCVRVFVCLFVCKYICTFSCDYDLLQFLFRTYECFYNDNALQTSLVVFFMYR